MKLISKHIYLQRNKLYLKPKKLFSIHLYLQHYNVCIKSMKFNVRTRAGKSEKRGKMRKRRIWLCISLLANTSAAWLKPMLSNIELMSSASRSTPLTSSTARQSAGWVYSSRPWSKCQRDASNKKPQKKYHFWNAHNSWTKSPTEVRRISKWLQEQGLSI